MGGNWRPLFNPPAFGFTNEQHELRGKKVFLPSYLKGCQIFFFFCRVNPNLKDLKPTFALKTESLFVFFGWRGGKKNKIPQRYFLPFCTRKLPSPSVETIFVSNFSHLSTRRQVSWGKAPDPADNVGGDRGSLFRAGLELPPRAVCKLLLMWEIGGPCQVAPTTPPGGPVRPNEICHKSGSRGTWERISQGRCKARTLEGPGPAREQTTTCLCRATVA